MVIKNPTGFPKETPFTSFTIPKRKIEIIKYRVGFEMDCLNRFRAKTEI